MRLTFRSIVAVLLLVCTCPAGAEDAVDASLPEYHPIPQLSGVLNTVGSSTISNLLTRWSAEFREIYPDVKIVITGGGSGSAVPALLDGSAHLAPMSRPMNAMERELFIQKFGFAPSEFIVGIDALAIYVEKSNPIAETGLTLQQVDAIFSRTRKRSGAPIESWGQAGLTGTWADKPISLYGFANTTGDYALFRDVALDDGDFKSSLNIEPVSSSVVQGVGADKNAIGYASIFFQTKRIRPVPIAAADGRFYLPTKENCQSQKYPLGRNFYIYVAQPPKRDLDPLTREFLRFICSRQGQLIATKDGNFPISGETSLRELERLKRP